MDDRSTKMLVIGAGPIGLCMAKSLAARGIPYDQVDADDDVGGNWKHGVYSTAHIVSSKKTTEYTDFPMPASYPDFPSRVQMLEYLRAYTEHFHLRKILELNTKVVSCRPTESTGSLDQRWEVELENGEQRLYKGVLVCNGHHWDRRWPTYPGTFTGEYLHSKDYKEPQQLAGKRVLIIGGGNSGCDLASEAARVGRSCHMSIRRGYWFLPKTIFGVPLVEALPGWLPVWGQRLFLKVVLKMVFGSYEKYGLPLPKQRIFDAHTTLNNELLHYIKHGKILPKPDVARFDGSRVHFTDGSIEEFDTVVCATGYRVSFPFLPPGLVPMTSDQLPEVYGGICLTNCRHLYLVGTMQPRYGFGPLITRGGDLISQIVQLQDKMELPFGLVLKEFGEKPSQTHLVNPHASLREMKRAPFYFPWIVRKEKRMRRIVSTNRIEKPDNMQPVSAK